MNRRRTLAGSALTLATFALGFGLAVAVSGSATAASGTTTAKKSTSTTKTTSTKATTTTKAPAQTTADLPTEPQTPASQFFVLNGTVDAASDHERIGSSAFPNFANGAVDNYYSLSRSHVDNSPFAQGTASPADTGPVGQTAAAGNFQQPQYADARWPGGPDKATYGNQGGPYATATAGEYKATADASAPTNDLSGPGTTGKLTLPVPKGFDEALHQALALWKAKWQGGPAPAKPAPTVTRPTVTVPNAGPTLPKPPVTLPKADTGSVTTPIAPLAAPSSSASDSSPAPAPATVSTPSVPTVGAPRSLSAAPPPDGETLLSSSTLAALVPVAEAATTEGGKTETTKTDTTKTDTTAKTGTTKSAAAPTYSLVTKGESRLGRVSIGGGQIVIEGIHVTASIVNDGNPSYKAAVSVASASIGGVPVTIDEDGVHVAGQGQGLPYKQASDALNGALKQAGVQIFLVGPEVTSCGSSGSPSGGGGGGGTSPSTTTTGTTTTTPAPSGGDQSQQSSSCPPSGSSTGCTSSAPTGTTTTSSTTTNRATTTTSTSPLSPTTTSSSSTMPCDQSSSTGCEPGGTSTTGSTTTTTGPTVTTPGSRTQSTTTTTTSTTQSTMPGGCDSSGTMPTAGNCPPAGGTGPATSPGGTQPGATAPSYGPLDPMNPGGGATSTEQTVLATGVHVVFTQPVNQSGVPAQYVEHILGEVFVDSLAVPAPPVSSVDLSSSLSASSAGGGPNAAPCGGVTGAKSGKTAGGALAAGGSSTGGSAASLAGGSASGSSLSPTAAGSAVGASMQPGSGSGSGVTSLPAAFATALRKPMWLLIAYLVWQALVIGTGVSLRNWRREDAT